MWARKDKDNGLRILSIDRGGIRALSQLIILKELMNRLEVDLNLQETPLVCDYFDIIAGTGSGGLIAVLLGRLCLTVDQAIEEFVGLYKSVFNDRKDPGKEDAFKATKLESRVEDILGRYGLPPDAKLDGKDSLNGKCKVFVCAVSTSNLDACQLFRTYDARTRIDCTIIEAVRATMASPSFFKPVVIGPKDFAQEYIGGSIVCNNPSRQLLKEARTVFGNDRRLALILNVGAGRPQVLSLSQAVEGDVAMDDVVTVLESIAVDCETMADELGHQFSEVGVYYRLSVDRGMETVGVHEWREFEKVATHTQAYLQGPVANRLIELCLQSLKAPIGSITLQELNQSALSITRFKGLPPLTPYFVMRPEVWNAMQTSLIAKSAEENARIQRIFVICGMGGSGKTQLSIRFAKEYHTSYSHVFFLDGSSEATIRGDLQAAIRSQGTGFSQQTADDSLAFLARKQAGFSWLLIFDNVDDPAIDLRQFFPQCDHGAIIVTTRNRDLAQLATTMHWQLGPMTDDEAVDVLLRSAHRPLPPTTKDAEIALGIVRGLGHLPVALVQAGSYSFRMHCFERYLDLYNSNRSKLLRDKATSQLDHYHHSVYAAIDTSYAALPQGAKELLHVCAFLHNTSIPRAMFSIGAKSDFLYEADVYDVPRIHSNKHVAQLLRSAFYEDGQEWDEMHFHEILHSLQVFSLVSTVHASNEAFLHFHPLVHSWARDSLTSRDDVLRYKAMAVRLLVCSTGADHWMLHRYLMPHILEIVEHGDLHPNDNSAFAKVLAEAGVYEDALNLRKEVKRACRMWNGARHWRTLDALANLADTYCKQGSWAKAATLSSEVWEFRRKLMGAEDGKTLRAEASLAFTYHQLGRWKEAEELQLEVLNLRKRLLGPKHIDTIQASADLAHSFIQQGKWAEAEDLGLEVYRERRKLLGDEHPDTLLASSNLALIYYEQCRFKEAEVLEQEVLALRRKVLGAEHPDTLDSMNNIAATLSQLDRWQEAQAIEEEVLALRRKLHGPTHPDTISASNNLAVTYREVGNLQQAQELLEAAFAERCKAVGNDHPDTLHPLANLTLTYHLQGRLEDAKRLAVKAVVLLKDVVDTTDHPVFRKTLNKVSAILDRGPTYDGEKRRSVVA